MISKREILNMTFGIVDEVERLEEKVKKLETEVKKIKSCTCGKNTDGVKRKPGRPRKEKKA